MKILESTKVITSLKNRRTKNQTNSIFTEPKINFKFLKKKKVEKETSFFLKQ